jgi:hypothetical protein
VHYKNIPIGMISELEAFYLGKEEPNRGCLLALRKLILKKNASISETRKYGMPCFCYGKKAFCYLWTDKKTLEPYILFVEGKLLEHPDLESGTRSRMKIFKVDPTIDLPIDTINNLLNLALAIYR